MTGNRWVGTWLQACILHTASTSQRSVLISCKNCAEKATFLAVESCSRRHLCSYIYPATTPAHTHNHHHYHSTGGTREASQPSTRTARGQTHSGSTTTRKQARKEGGGCVFVWRDGAPVSHACHIQSSGHLMMLNNPIWRPENTHQHPSRPCVYHMHTAGWASLASTCTLV